MRRSMACSGLIVLALFASPSALASSVLLKVSLYPIGSFEIKSSAIKGKGVKKDGSYTASLVKVPVKSLKTGLELRDEHMQKRLNPDGKSPDVMIKNIKAAGGKGTAALTVAGITKKVVFKYKEVGASSAEATFKVNLPDFNITDVSYKGVGVEDEVEIIATLDYEGK